MRAGDGVSEGDRGTAPEKSGTGAPAPRPHKNMTEAGCGTMTRRAAEQPETDARRPPPPTRHEEGTRRAAAGPDRADATRSGERGRGAMRDERGPHAGDGTERDGAADRSERAWGARTGRGGEAAPAGAAEMRAHLWRAERPRARRRRGGRPRDPALRAERGLASGDERAEGDRAGTGRAAMTRDGARTRRGPRWSGRNGRARHAAMGDAAGSATAPSKRKHRRSRRSDGSERSPG